MGAILPKACLSTIIERKAHTGLGFRVGVSEMNGWRNKMEDAHVIHMKNDWGFFAIFDGHGGDQCSAYVAKKFYEKLEADGCPVDDAAVKALVLGIDHEFLESGLPSGSTGAMCIVHKPKKAGDKVRLRVINVGDSRVFLGRKDGSIVDGGGTEEGLSTDHKPDHPSERERIVRCGGRVETAAGGVPRVNGDLAVSRGFGDAEYKKTGGPGPEDRPVTADPELGDFECDESDFLVIACDGVSEGNFPNPEVVKLIGDHLQNSPGFAGGAGDPGSAAREVILKAEKQASKDNITCMIIQFTGASENVTENVEFEPGPISCDPSGYDQMRGFITCYEAMAKRADRTLAESLELRYNNICKTIVEEKEEEDEIRTLVIERDAMVNRSWNIQEYVTGGTDKAPTLKAEFFEKLAEDLCPGGDDSGNDRIPPDIARLLQCYPQVRDMMQHGGAAGMGDVPDRERRVKITDLATLMASVEGHPALKWEEKLEGLANSKAAVTKIDKSDDTVQVKCKQLMLQAWIPESCITYLPEDDEEDGPDTGEGSPGTGGYGTGSDVAT